MAKALKKRTQELKDELEMLHLTIYGLEYQRDHFMIDDEDRHTLKRLHHRKRDIQDNLNRIAKGTA